MIILFSDPLFFSSSSFHIRHSVSIFPFSVHVVTLAAGANSGKPEHSPDLYTRTLREQTASYKLITTTSPAPFALHPAVLLFRDSETTQSSPLKPHPTQRLTEEHESDFVDVKELLQKYRHALEAAIDPKDSSDLSVDAEDGDSFHNDRKTLGAHSKTRLKNQGSERLNTRVLIESNDHLDIKERLNRHTSDASKSHHERTQAGKSGVDESELRKPKPTKVHLAPGHISMGRRGNLDRFTGIIKPKQLLPPTQRTETTTIVPIFTLPDTRSHLKPNIRERKAKRVRFGRKRRPGRRRTENAQPQEILKPVSVINGPGSKQPPFTIPSNYEYGKKKIEAVKKAEELPLHVGDKGNITFYYPRALASTQKPRVEIRKYTLLAESKPGSVTVTKPPVTYPRGVFLWGERLGSEHTRARVKGKARRVTVGGYERKLEEPHVPVTRESETREAVPDPLYGRFLSPPPAGINGPPGPLLYFLPAEDESKSQPRGEEGSYVRKKPRQEIWKKEGNLYTFDPSSHLPPSYRSAEGGVDGPLYIPTYGNYVPLITSVSTYEPASTPFPHSVPFTTTTTTLKPAAPPRPFPSSTRPSPPPPPLPHLNEVTERQVSASWCLFVY